MPPDPHGSAAISSSIERSSGEDADRLTQIATAAKRHWGYPDAWMRSWQPALTITPAEIARHPTYHLRQDGRILGFFLLQLEGDQARLEHCWILPEAMGLGFGRALFARAEGVARESGANKISIVSDPHAEGFYLRMGARSCGQEPSSVDGVPRFLPRLEKLL